MGTDEDSGPLLFEDLFGGLRQGEGFARSIRTNNKDRRQAVSYVGSDGHNRLFLLCI